MVRALYLYIAILLLPGYAFGDRIVLRNGDVISGTVMAWRDGSFEIKTALLGDVKAPWNAISSIQTAKPLFVILRDQAPGQALQCDSMTVTDAGVQFAGNDCDKKFVDKSALQSIESESIAREEVAVRQASVLDLWTGSFDAGFSAARSDASSTNVNLGMKAVRATYSDRITLSATSLYSQSRSNTGQDIDSSAIRAAAHYARNLSPHSFAFGFANFETNDLQSLDLREVLGTGLGFRLASSPHLRLDLFSGGSFLQESFAEQPGRTAGEMLFGQELAFKPGRAELSQTVSLYPNLTDRGEYRVSLDSSVSVSLNKWLSWHTTLSNIYISNPPISTPGNSFLASTGFRVSMGKEHQFKPNAKVVGF